MPRLALLALLGLAALPAQTPLDRLLAGLPSRPLAEQLAAMQSFAAAPAAPAAVPELLARLRTAAPDFDNDGCLLLEAILRAHPDAALPVGEVRDALLAVVARPRWTSRQKAAQALAVLLQRPAARDGAEAQLARALVPLTASQRGRVVAAGAAALAALPGVPAGADPLALRAWCHRRFGGAVDLHSAKFEVLWLLREQGERLVGPDGAEVPRAALAERIAAARAAAAAQRRDFAAVLQVDDEALAAAVRAPGLGRYGPLLAELAAAAGGDATLAPASDRFGPEFAEPAGQHATRRAALQQRLAARCGDRAPGAQAAVALPDGTLLEFTHGTADRDARTPMPSDGRLLAGSIGKTFFAALALQLAGEGRLGLDDAVARWLGTAPWWPRLPHGPQLTVRHLLQHRSGLPRYEFAPAFTAALAARPDHRFTPEEEVAFVFDAVPRFRPGEGFEYADTNYVLLGLVLERVLGGDCYQAIELRFLRPLALGGTVPSVGRRIPGLLPGYAGEGNPFGGRDAMLQDGALPFDAGFEGAGGGFATTAGDLARWGQALWCGPLLGELRRELLDGPPAPLGREARYGCGSIVQPTRAGLAVGHRGFFPGWLGELRAFPADGLVVAILVNSSQDRGLARDLAEWAVELAEVARGR